MTIFHNQGYINVGVESKNVDAKVAQEENSKQMEAVINALKDHGLTDEDIKTISYNIWRGVDYRSEEQIEEILHDEDNPLFNRVISGIGYPTGSTIKPLIAATALQENVISANRSINCRGLIEVEHEYDSDIVYQYHDWEVHGFTDMRKAIAESCNIYFYSIGGGNKAFGIDGLGGSTIKKYLELRAEALLTDDYRASDVAWLEMTDNTIDFIASLRAQKNAIPLLLISTTSESLLII